MKVLDQYARQFPRPSDKLLKPLIDRYNRIFENALGAWKDDLFSGAIDPEGLMNKNDVRFSIVTDKKTNEPAFVFRVKPVINEAYYEDIAQLQSFFSLYTRLVDSVLTQIGEGIRLEASLGKETYRLWQEDAAPEIRARITLIELLINRSKTRSLTQDMFDTAVKLASMLQTVGSADIDRFLVKHNAVKNDKLIAAFYSYGRMINRKLNEAVDAATASFETVSFDKQFEDAVEHLGGVKEDGDRQDS